ncbi:DUF692 domain-containing protein [Erythrobacter donghaensis]|jgi:uncharacterized protein (UPF0276 family)|uniref:MNIO family bufferin maturase n=1 Tax=Erythrobacter donghaensis TaxID=267135 RepID=UPI000938A956|nr:DUF692 domain-containing protein [Erythrobacter donghaensis]
MIPTAGVGLKASHIAEALASPAAGLWFEVHAENYMVAGGPRLSMLDEARAARPLSLHGVGMSLAGHELPDVEHLAAFKALIGRFEPFLISEHLAWSRMDGRSYPDLLPFPRTSEALETVCRNIDFAQSLLGRQLLIENPSHYLALEGHEWSETEFLVELARRTGCGLLLDLNNVHVSAANLGFDPHAYLAAFPGAAVGEIHIAGHSPDAALDLLIDSHDAPVGEPVWGLLEGFFAAHGPRPVLIERDRDVPPFAALLREQHRAAQAIAAATIEERDDA